MYMGILALVAKGFCFTTCAGIPMSLKSPMHECVIPQHYTLVTKKDLKRFLINKNTYLMPL
jgi:hypothetical protein